MQPTPLVLRRREAASKDVPAHADLGAIPAARSSADEGVSFDRFSLLESPSRFASIAPEDEGDNCVTASWLSRSSPGQDGGAECS